MTISADLLGSGGGGGGGVNGPSTSVVGDIAIWNNTTGTLLSDTGIGTFTDSGGSLIIAADAYGPQFYTGAAFNNLGIQTNFPNLISGAFGNVAFGANCFSLLSIGNSNLGLGTECGSAYTGAESNNILLNSNGIVGESNAMHLGDIPPVAAPITAAYIGGVSGTTVTGAAVLCSTSGQLGTVVSSIRYKENVKSIDESILDLNPVRFNYISDPTKAITYGLIAEEVNETFPTLCLYKNGIPDSVKYHEMPALLLKEIQRLHKRIEALENVSH